MYTAPTRYHRTAMEPGPDDADGPGNIHEVRHPHAPAVTGEDGEKPFSLLPARQLPVRSAQREAMMTIQLGIVTTVIVFGLIATAAQIHRPSAQTMSSPNGGTTYTSINTLSCDVATENKSSVQTAFIIDLRAGGQLTFTQAKAIDVMWQLLIGAGGRFLMSWISYKAFMDGLTRLMEQSPVSFKMHASLTFSTDSLRTIWYAIKEIFRIRGWRGKAFLAWFTISTVYVIAFQTIVSATAGYVQPSSAGYRMFDGSVVNTTSSALTNCFDILDGQLIGLSNGTLVNGPPVSDYDIMASMKVDRSIALAAADLNPITAAKYPDFTFWMKSVVFNPQPNQTFYGPVIPGGIPGGNEPQQAYNSSFTFKGKTYNFTDYTFAYDSSYKAAYCYDNKTVGTDDLGNIIHCVPLQYFVWGLSSLVVIIVLSLQVVWIVGTYIVWLDARRSSQLCRHNRKVRGPFRAVQDLSEAVTEALGGKTCTYSDSEMAHVLRRHPGLRYYSRNAEEKEPHIGLTTDTGLSLDLEDSVKYGARDERKVHD